MADLRIDIAAEFAGKKAFREAEQASLRLDKTVKRLGRSLGITLSTAAIIRYSKQSIKAFADDEAAANRLSTAVSNLGYSLSQVKVKEFIASTEASAGILDDKLRPAFQALLTTTGSLTQSQILLNDAIQISRASGIELATVAQDLANGYVGITRGLKKYNTGLTQAELKSKSFNEILGIMLKNSAGAADEYLTSTSYKLDILSVAAANAQETIGKGLVDAFARIGGGTEAKDAAHAIDSIAKAVNAVTLALGFTIGAINKFRQGYTNFLMDPLGTGMPSSAASTNRSASPAGTARRMAQQNAAEAAAKKRAKELLAAQTKNTAELKKQAALKKAGTVFDLEQIQLMAALKGKLSAEERTRVEAQLAILNQNDVLAQQLTKQILMAQDATGGLYQYFLAIGDAKIKNPFAFLDQWILDFQAKLNALKFPTMNPETGAKSSVSVWGGPSSQSYSPAWSNGGNGTPGASFPDTIDTIASTYSTPTGNFTYGQGNPLSNVYVPPTINITVQGSIIREQELIDQVLAGTQLSSLSGSPSQLARISGMFQ
jgi:hypothetical protein